MREMADVIDALGKPDACDNGHVAKEGNASWLRGLAP